MAPHSCPLLQAVQEAPWVPQAVESVPATQLPWVSQQPLAHVDGEHGSDDSGTSTSCVGPVSGASPAPSHGPPDDDPLPDPDDAPLSEAMVVKSLNPRRSAHPPTRSVASKEATKSRAATRRPRLRNAAGIAFLRTREVLPTTLPNTSFHEAWPVRGHRFGAMQYPNPVGRLHQTVTHPAVRYRDGAFRNP
jgi:hypothetical protein